MVIDGLLGTSAVGIGVTLINGFCCSNYEGSAPSGESADVHGTQSKEGVSFVRKQMGLIDYLQLVFKPKAVSYF